MAKSSLSSLIPLIILLFVIVIGAAVGFVVYQIANDVASKTAKKMEKHNVSFGPEGVKVGVKSMSAEEVGDSTQSVLVNLWNNSYFPAYKSRIWGSSNKPATGSASGSGTNKRQPYSRTSSQPDAKKA